MTASMIDQPAYTPSSRRPHQSSQTRQLQHVADQLKQTYNKLLEERSQLLQQQFLLTSLADVLGQYRSALSEEEDMFPCLPRRGGLEELLLDQLTLRLPSSLTLNRTASSNSAGSSSDSNSAGLAADDGDGAADGDEAVSSSPDAVVVNNNANTARHVPFSSLGPQLHSAPAPQQQPRRSSSAGMMSVDGQQYGGPQLQEGLQHQHQHQHQGQPDGQRGPDWMQSSSCQAGFSLESLQETSAGPEQRQEGMHQLAQLQQLVQPVCPEHDPFLLMRSVYSQPFEEAAYTITLKELQELWAGDVQQLRCHLLQLQAGLQQGSIQLSAPAPPSGKTTTGVAAAGGGGGHPVGGGINNNLQGSEQQQAPAACADPLLSIRDVMMRMFVMCWSLAAAGKISLFFELQLTNWATGERIQEPDKERHRAVLQELQLSQPQMQRIAAGFKFFQQLLGPIVAERKQLQAKGVVMPLDTQQATRTQHGSCRATVGAALMLGPAAHSGQGMCLQAQCEQVARLALLSRKDTMVRGAMVNYLQGCLSWVQQAKLRILMSPYHVNPGAFCVEVVAQLQQQQQQQQQALSQSPAGLLHTATAAVNGVGAAAGAGSSTPMSLG